MESGASVNRNNFPVRSTSFVPASTILYPDCALEICLDMFAVVVIGFRGNFHRVNILGLEFVDAVVNVDADRLDAQNERAVRDWKVGSNEA